MKRVGLLALIGLGIALASPAHAVPPTVTPSPGYDARLQEQRARSQAPVLAPAGTAAKPSASRRKKRAVHR